MWAFFCKLPAKLDLCFGSESSLYLWCCLWGPDVHLGSIAVNSFPCKHTDLFGGCSSSWPAGCCSSWVILLLLQSHAFGSAFISVHVLLLRQKFPSEASSEGFLAIIYSFFSSSEKIVKNRSCICSRSMTRWEKQPNIRASPALIALNRLFLNAGGRVLFLHHSLWENSYNDKWTGGEMKWWYNIFYKHPLLLFTYYLPLKWQALQIKKPWKLLAKLQPQSRCWGVIKCFSGGFMPLFG